MTDYIPLADIIGRAAFLELCCGRCERRGRLSVPGPVRECAACCCYRAVPPADALCLTGSRPMYSAACKTSALHVDLSDGELPDAL
jgi:hypothetical protein